MKVTTLDSSPSSLSDSSDSSPSSSEPSRREFLKALAGLSIFSALPTTVLTACGEQPPLNPENTQQVQSLLGVAHQALKIIDCDDFDDHRHTSLNAIVGGVSYSIKTLLESTKDSDGVENNRVLALYRPIDFPSFSSWAGFNKFTVGIGHMEIVQTEAGYTQRSFRQKALVEINETDLFIFPISNFEDKYELPKAFQIPLNGDFPSSFLVQINQVSNWELQIQRLSRNVNFTPTDSLGAWSTEDYKSSRERILERY
ncbi:hypothetical protein HOH51_00270 [bacterium]|jgi:hypothetical protein|nr:hypothetical protein [bacterium]